MMNSDHTLEDLISFIRKKTGAFKMPIDSETLIEDQLGVTGDDGEELISSFAKEYQIDISNFVFNDYLYDEPGMFNIPNRKVKPLNVGHLHKAIIAGKLDEEVIAG